MIYLDHASTTPLDPRVLETMLPWLKHKHGNPSSIHTAGREARQAVEQSRSKVAAAINVDPKDIVFTSSASEANNLFIKGSVDATSSDQFGILTTRCDHPSVVKTCEFLEATRNNITLSFTKVSESGLNDRNAFISNLKNSINLVSMIHVNNETGVHQDVEGIAHECSQRGIALLLDSVQALGKVPVDATKIGCAAMSISSHKVYGPKGIAGLYIREGNPMRPLIHGGPQESGKRAGTEFVAGIIGFGRACELLMHELDSRKSHIMKLENELIQGMQDREIQFTVNGDEHYRTPGILNVSFTGYDGGDILIALDLKGICISSGSACSSGVIDRSPVLSAMYGNDDSRVKSAIRFSLGKDTTMEDVRATVDALCDIVKGRE